ncbi:MAG TPA: YncE family protein [Steroidobacteraceae bacterium]|nr:YncE family protein [Steroidobacteraceae bacterium]
MAKGRALLGVSLIGLAGLAQGAGYTVAEHWALGGEGGWDYPSVDSHAHRLYLSRATHVLIVDTATGKGVADIADTPGVHGIAVAADVGRGFISEGKANAVKVFELASGKVLADIAVGGKPDAIVYDAKTHRVVAFNGHDDSASVIDARSNRVLRTLPLGGAPEAAGDDGAGHVFVNLEDKNQLVAIDAETPAVTAHWDLPGCEGPTGFALDAAHHRAFSSCANAVMAILDTTSGRSLATLPIGKGTDGAEFDPALQNAYSANGEGTITIVHESDPDHFAVLETLPTARGARTIALDPATHRLYLPTAKFGTLPAGSKEKHPPILPDTFEVLVVTAPSAAHPSAGR